MEISAKNLNMSDDEDDLELLRLAALQTIKKPVINSIPQQQQPPPSAHNNKPQHHARSHFSGPGRGGRGGHFNGRTRNTNLISVPVLHSEKDGVAPSRKDDLPPAPKLILPQDRYCNKTQQSKQEEGKAEPCSKFSRYDHSDESDSEEESEAETSPELKRADSLEALMDELEFELTGVKVPKAPEKAKKTKSKRKNVENVDNKSINAEKDKSESGVKGGDKTPEIEVKSESKAEPENAVKAESNVVTESKVMPENNVTPEIKTISKNKIASGNDVAKDVPVVGDKLNERLVEIGDRIEGNLVEERKTFEERPLPPRRRRSPLLNGSRRHVNNRNYHRPHQNGFAPVYPEPRQSFNYNYNPPPVNHYNLPPPTYPQTNFLPHRPLSPLNLNTDVLSTIAMAPLSPRSAAFVLQNREIIERRKKSPRRSYSRSPSPSYNYRRAASPYRSPSPRSRSPPYSPKRNSPPRNTSPARYRRKPTPPKASIKERLGINRVEKVDDNKRGDNNKEKQPEESNIREKNRNNNGKIEDKDKPDESNASKVRLGKTEEPAVVDTVETDSAVLEARKRKFEENTEVTATEGIIRLKPKTDNTNPVSQESEEQQEDEEEDLEDDLLDLDVNETMVDSLLSDEESDDENEGRFKLQTSNPRQKTTIIPFTQLSANKDRNITTLSLEEKPRNDRRDQRDCSRRRRRRSLSPSPRGKLRKIDEPKTGLKNRVGVKRERSREKDKILADNKKSRSPEKVNPVKSESSVRRVAIAKSTKENDDFGLLEVPVVVDDEENDVTVKKDAGDLRAQLSRKRAERQQHKHPVATEDVQSRLLHNALEGAVFKNSRKLNAEKEAAPKDKLPIHMRLGLAKEPEKCKESKRRKKKNRNSEQV